MGIFTNPNEILPFHTLLVPKANLKQYDYQSIYDNTLIMILHWIRIILYKNVNWFVTECWIHYSLDDIKLLNFDHSIEAYNFTSSSFAIGYVEDFDETCTRYPYFIITIVLSMYNSNNLPMPLIHLNTIKLPRIIQLEPVNARSESKSHLLHVIIDCMKRSLV